MGVEREEFAAMLRELKERSGRSYGALATRLYVSTSTLLPQRHVLGSGRSRVLSPGRGRGEHALDLGYLLHVGEEVGAALDDAGSGAYGRRSTRGWISSMLI
ncbi:hypothetical protein ACQP1V_08285 [Microtetraspora malaysiensis]|uniref:hypothetical protein n=1 Tax=Microtetraspora malaysiensis TaxID=161358 RepID=UPI003D8FE075